MNDLLQSFWQQLLGQSGWEAAAVICALAYISLAAQKNMLCWLFAFISSAIYVHLFWRYQLPFHAVLNGYYVVMAVYGWWQWHRRQPDDTFSRRLHWRTHLIFIGVLVVISVLLASGAQTLFDSQYVFLDATITVFSVFTTVLVAHRVWENWLYWIVINSAAIWLYMANGLMLTSLLFAFYIAFSVYGLFNWRKELQTV